MDSIIIDFSCEPSCSISVIKTEPVFVVPSSSNFRKRWTLEWFLFEVNVKFGDKFDLSAINSSNFSNSKSRIFIKCNTCGLGRETSAITFLNLKFGCRKCGDDRLTNWNLEKFAAKIQEIHGSKYDISGITDEQLSRIKSLFPIKCNSCGYRWETTIDRIINSKSGCKICARDMKMLTMDDIIHKIKQKYGLKYDVSKLTLEHIERKSGNSGKKFSVKCNDCGHEWDTTAGMFIQRTQNCEICIPKLERTLENFYNFFISKFGHNFDLSNITSTDILSTSNKLLIICKICQYNWRPQLSKLNTSKGCPRCNGNAHLTLDDVKNKIIAVHGDKYDLSLIQKEHIKNGQSKIPIICRKCGTQKAKGLGFLIYYNYECGRCHFNNLRNFSSLEEFKNKVFDIFGNKFDLSMVQPNDVILVTNKVSIKCNDCGMTYRKPLRYIISHRHGCRKCKNLITWTYDILMPKLLEMYGDKYDLSQVKPEHVSNNRSRIPVKCNKCGHCWNKSVSSLVSNCNPIGCSNCAGNLMLTYEVAIKKIEEIHDSLDLSLIKPEHINGRKKSRITLRCKRKGHVWTTSLNSTLCGSRCRRCKGSRGERDCFKVLQEMGIEIETEYILDSLKYKRFDIFFTYEGRKFLIEYDGKQHFEYVHFFHRTQEMFEKRVRYDIEKSYHAHINGYFLIRIDYNSDVESHLKHALETHANNNMYYSNVNMYKHIIDYLATMWQNIKA